MRLLGIYCLSVLCCGVVCAQDDEDDDVVLPDRKSVV